MKTFIIKKWLWLLLSLLMIIPVLIFLKESSHAALLGVWIAQHKIIFLIWRIFLLAVFWVIWPVLMHHYAKKQEWEPDYLKRMLNKRWSLALWLIVLDLIMVENILSFLF